MRVNLERLREAMWDTSAEGRNIVKWDAMQAVLDAPRVRICNYSEALALPMNHPCATAHSDCAWAVLVGVEYP